MPISGRSPPSVAKVVLTVVIQHKGRQTAALKPHAALWMRLVSPDLAECTSGPSSPAMPSAGVTAWRELQAVVPSPWHTSERLIKVSQDTCLVCHLWSWGVGHKPANVQNGAQVFAMPTRGREPLLSTFYTYSQHSPLWLMLLNLAICHLPIFRVNFSDDLTLPGTERTAENERGVLFQNCIKCQCSEPLLIAQ